MFEDVTASSQYFSLDDKSMFLPVCRSTPPRVVYTSFVTRNGRCEAEHARLSSSTSRIKSHQAACLGILREYLGDSNGSTQHTLGTMSILPPSQ
jgi:hypothetical protein